MKMMTSGRRSRIHERSERERVVSRGRADCGWLAPGALFALDSAHVLSNGPGEPGSGQITQPRLRKLKAGEKLLVISQTCDVRASVSEEPFVLAYVCKQVTNQVFLDRVALNSARYFVVDRGAGLVAQAKYPVLVAKEVLARVRPEPWPGDDHQFARFVRWVARRFDRPALSDHLVEAFQKPVEQALNSLCARRPDVGSHFSDAVHEVRVSLPEGDDAPYHVQLVLLARRPELAAEEYEAIEAVMAAIRDALDPAAVQLERMARVVTEHEISWGEYRRTRPLYLEYLTYRGDEARGIEPFPRA